MLQMPPKSISRQLCLHTFFAVCTDSVGLDEIYVFVQLNQRAKDEHKSWFTNKNHSQPTKVLNKWGLSCAKLSTVWFTWAKKKTVFKLEF